MNFFSLLMFCFYCLVCQFGWTALLREADRGKLEVVVELLRAGAYVNQKNIVSELLT